MILADTSTWIEHFRSDLPALRALLMEERVVMHPFVAGELAVGNLATRRALLSWFTRMEQAPVASHLEVMAMIERRRLFGRGVGYIDLHLLASMALGPGNQFWTQDRRLRVIASELGVELFEG